jgi:hypothetical protein
MLNGHDLLPDIPKKTPIHRNYAIASRNFWATVAHENSISEALTLVALIIKAVFFLRDEMTILKLKQPPQEAVK